MSPAVNREILQLPTDGSLSHNWLYSFLPVGKENYPALVGFCKQCRHTFTYVMYVDTDSKGTLQNFLDYDAKIPKYGCVPVEE